MDDEDRASALEMVLVWGTMVLMGLTFWVLVVGAVVLS